MFDDTHSIFIQSKGQQILSGVAEVREHIFNGKNFQNFLYEMSRVIISTKLVEILSYLHNHEGELFIQTKVWNKSLQSMSSLLVFDQVAESRHYFLKYLKSLVRMTYREQFLNHIVPVLMHNKLHCIWFDMSDDELDLTWTCHSQIVLEDARLSVIFDKLDKFVATYKLL